MESSMGITQGNIARAVLSGNYDDWTVRELRAKLAREVLARREDRRKSKREGAHGK